MSVRLILVPLGGESDRDDSGSLEALTVEAAFRAGQAFGARVRVCCVSAPAAQAQRHLSPWMPGYGLEQVFEMLDAASQRQRERARQAFRTTVERLAAPLAADGAAPGFAVEFVEEAGDAWNFVANQGKLTDLIVFARPRSALPLFDSPTLEAALCETGRPVLLVPATPFATIGDHVAVGWNGSHEASRAVAMSIDLLRRADRVTILSVSDDDRSVEPSGTRLVDYLRHHDIDASMVTAEGTAHTAGARLLIEAARAEADLLLMGAHTRSRVRRLVFGGATQHVLRDAPMPVIMVG